MLNVGPPVDRVASMKLEKYVGRSGYTLDYSLIFCEKLSMNVIERVSPGKLKVTQMLCLRYYVLHDVARKIEYLMLETGQLIVY